MEKNLKFSLLSLRVSVFIVMLFWTIDKMINPEHANNVFQKFYHIGSFSKSLMMAIGVIELVLIVAFLAGIKKRFTYGLVFLLHFISTVSSYQQYLNPFEKGNLLFFAGIPMLAACFTLFLHREDDTLLTLKPNRK